MIIKTAREIGMLVRDQRKQLKWTQDQLATRLGVSRLWVVQMEQGKETAQIGLVLRALNELGIPFNVELPDPTAKPIKRRPDDFDLDFILQEAAKPYGS